MTAYCTIYVTVPSRAEGVAISRSLLEEKLIACVNISAEMLSLYQWDGKIAQESERAMIIKTRKDRAEQVIARIKALHPYDTPCIVQWDIAGGDGQYLSWMNDSIC